MALVLYNGDNKPDSTGRATASSTASKGSSMGKEGELERITKRIENLSSNARITPYIGLQNQGATCYMNSLI